MWGWDAFWEFLREWLRLDTICVGSQWSCTNSQKSQKFVDKFYLGVSSLTGVRLDFRNPPKKKKCDTTSENLNGSVMWYDIWKFLREWGSTQFALLGLSGQVWAMCDIFLKSDLFLYTITTELTVEKNSGSSRRVWMGRCGRCAANFSTVGFSCMQLL